MSNNNGNNGNRNIGPDLEGYGAGNGAPPSQPVYVVGSPSPAMGGRSDSTMLPALRSYNPGFYGPPPEEPAAPPPPNYFKIALQNLRGRLLLASVLSILFAGIAFGLVWHFVRPTYQSESLIRIEYTRPVILHETDTNAPLQRFEAFIQSQRTLITSRRVVDMAVQDPIWKASGRPVPAFPDQYFGEHLAVETQFQSEFIRIVVSDTEPATPAAAVTAVTNAYVQLYTSDQKTKERERNGVLEEKQGVLKKKIEDLQAQLRAATQEWGTTNLTMWIADAQDRLLKLKESVNTVQLAIASMPKSGGAAVGEAAVEPTTRPAPQGATKAELVEQIAGFDHSMAAALDEKSQIQDEIDRLISKGLGEKHPTVLDAKDRLAIAQKKIDKRLGWQLAFRDASGHFADQSGPGISTAGKSVAELKADETKLTALCEQAQRELTMYAVKQMDFQHLQSDLEDAHAELEQVAKRLESLQTEATMAGRLTVITSGEIPLSPSKDPRKKYGALAAAGGAFLPIAAIIAIGMIGGRFRYSTETETEIMPEIPFLGILPELGSKDLNDDRSVAAAHSIHQIRVSVQSHNPDGERRIYLITSATASEGKTGLSMALGLSFAAAELKTLVIDFDLVGRSLTSRLDVKDEAGVCEAIDQGTIRGMCREVGGGLWVLPAGRGTASNAYAITTGKVRRLLDEARQDFDVVIVDTGPILGSIEAAVLAREVDGVILAVSRGRTRGMVRNAVRRLQSLGAKPLGFVFNRAKATDFAHSPYSSSSVTSLPYGGVRRSSPIVTPPPANAEHASRLKELGPLVRAVASGTPITPRDEN